MHLYILTKAISIVKAGYKHGVWHISCLYNSVSKPHVMLYRILLSVVLGSSLLMTSCIKNEYHTVEPEEPPITAPVYNYVFDDNFDDNFNNWAFSDPANAAFVSINRGMLKYTYLPEYDGTNTVAVSTGAKLHRNFLIQTSMKTDNAMGLVFGVSDIDYGYSFFIDNEGYYSLYKEGTPDLGVQTILDWQFSNAIQPNGWNDVELEQVGNYWYGYINGTEVFKLPANILNGDQVGYIVLAGTTGYADYLTVQW